MINQSEIHQFYGKIRPQVSPYAKVRLRLQVSPAALGLTWTPSGHELAFPILIDGPDQPTGASVKAALLKNVQRLRDAGEHVASAPHTVPSALATDCVCECTLLTVVLCAPHCVWCRHVVLCIDRGPQVIKYTPTVEEHAFGMRAGEYDRYSGLYCDREGIVTSRPHEPTAYAVQVRGQTPMLGSPLSLSLSARARTCHCIRVCHTRCTMHVLVPRHCKNRDRVRSPPHISGTRACGASLSLCCMLPP